MASDNLAPSDVTNLANLFTDTTRNSLDGALQEAMAINEADRMLDSIALTADCMEEDMAQALFNFEEDEFEEILDDFCLTANQEVIEEEGEDGEGGAREEFDYEQHIKMLIAKAQANEAGIEEGGRELEDDFFSGAKPLHEQAIDEEEEDDFDYDKYGEYEEDSLDREFGGADDDESAPTPAPISDEQQRVLIQKFEETLLDYDSDDVGDLDDECEEIVGSRPLEGDTQLEAALDEFLTEKKDEVLIEGTKSKSEKRTGGSGYAALVDKTMVNASQLADANAMLQVNMEESKKQMQKDLADADAILANPEMDLPPEEILIDGKSYFSATPRSQWDCESILSTYSNLDNNPTVIGRSRRKKKRGKKNKVGVVDDDSCAIPEDAPVKIQLSNKTGLPLGVFDNPASEDDEHYYEEDTYISVNKGEARPRNEAKMEKKMRKLAIKEERKICRIQKKMMKEAFRDEFSSRANAEVVDAVGGQTVYRFG